MLLQKSIGTRRRPLSWMMGPQGMEPVTPPSMRDEKRATRQGVRDIRQPDGI